MALVRAQAVHGSGGGVRGDVEVWGRRIKSEEDVTPHGGLAT